MDEADADGVTVRIVLSFPEAGVVPRLALFRCHGVGVVLALLRDGEVMAAGTKASELRDLRRLRGHLLPGLCVV